jgi:outer membrane protein assembly factor BamD (BamD/ComL family)
MLKRTISPVFVFVLMFGLPGLVISQPTWTLDVFGKEKKPEKFENRKLGSEKTAEKKFTVPRNFYQNTVTHYNYYYTANNRVNTVVERAKLSYKDDFSNLLAFYPYTLENTSSQKTELDSVIYTSTAGILLHDLRNDWIDNMYMLIGKAYFFRGDLDSALMTFQFINYNLFPRKRKNDDDDRIVGTTSSASGSSISIANREKRNILQKAVALPPSRNDALIWLSRTLIEQDEFAESGGLINTLQNDQNLPRRLYNDLEEVNAYWFYKQRNYDSAAVHLEKALSNADTKQDRARWEFLLAQLYEMSGNFDKASDYYTRASKHTVDPLLDIYGRLNEAKMMKGSGNQKELDKSIDNLLKMAKRDKYEGYRDIIYYSAGQLAMQKPDTNSAIIYYNKSIKRNESNINYRNRAYLELGDIAYSRKQYRLAASMYDSLQNGPDSILNKKIEQLQARKSALSKIAEAITNIEREDSLQRVALLSPAERDDLIKKLVRKLRKERGLKDDGSSGGGDIVPFGTNNPQPVDLFAGNSKGEWYFYNSSMKSRGFNEFKSKWGNRANADNWRRKSAVPENIATNPPGTTLDAKGNVIPVGTNAGNAQPADISYDALITRVPLTEEKLNASNEVIATNLLELAKLYQNELEEYALAAATYEDYLTRFPNRLQDGEVYLGLYFCYTKLGNNERAEYYKGLVSRKFPNSRSYTVLNNPGSLDPKTKNPAATQLYEEIYDLFIEGNFEKALLEKRKADSLYGVNYWSPQLLYIEALGYVKNRNDSIAITGLQTLMNTYPSSALKDKAATMIDVLRRRAEIENYLTSLQVTRAEDDKPIKVTEKPPVVNTPVVRPPVVADSAKKITPPAPLTSGPFVMAPASAHHVIMILDKVDGVYVNEARNAFNRYNKENYYGQPIQINKDAIDAERNLLVISPFADAASALLYYDKIRKSAAAEISWLPANKYSFMIITEENLQLLKSNKNITGYKALLNTQYPNRF